MEINPKDISLHFNLACAYSLTEQVDKAYMHIDRAVSLGFNDFEKLKTHDDLAFVRIQDRFEAFQKNGYRLELPAVETENTQIPEIPKEEPIQDDLLSQILSTYLPRHVMMYVCLCFFPKQKALSGCLFDSLPFERMKRAIINFKDIFVLHVMSLYIYENIVYALLLAILVISFL